MKILVISNLFPPEVLGGYEILCQQVCEGLRQAGHDILVLTTPAARPDSRAWVKRSLKLFLPFSRPARGRYRWNQAVCFQHNTKATQSCLEQFRPDVVFVWSQRRLTLACAKVCQAAGHPVCYTFNDEYLSFYAPAPMMGPLSYSGLDLSRSTCISAKLKANLLRTGAPIEDSKVIHQGIPLAGFPLRNRPVNKLERLLYVGQLHPYKGVHTAVEAAHRTGLPLTIVGHGPADYLRYLKNLAQEGPAKVTFRGQVAASEVSESYRRHDALLFPSVWEEPFGLTHLEAMASGLPVVSTVNGGQGEFLKDGHNCLTFAPGDSLALAAQLKRLQTNPRLLQRLAEVGRDTVESDFSLQGYQQRLISFLGAAA
ncbi:MAG: glycosyltransferase family 4 protein [Candidatus Eremiobacteraeota bacterium]|nr:glycosyltransferase family 4 protein [Candidatus Eremiobacteraeota bacterium]